MVEQNRKMIDGKISEFKAEFLKKRDEFFQNLIGNIEN